MGKKKTSAVKTFNVGECEYSTWEEKNEMFWLGRLRKVS